MYIFYYVNMPNVNAGYGRFQLRFLGIFHIITTCLKCYNFTELLQIVCYDKSVEMKSLSFSTGITDLREGKFFSWNYIFDHNFVG